MAKLSLKQIAYISIKQKILDCEYEPNSFLNEDILCEEFQMSRTPIRDALGRLEQEHLITILPKKGFFVTPLTLNEVDMVFEGRLLIEPYVIENYCGRMPAETLDRMYEILEESRRFLTNYGQSIKEDTTFYNLDNEFHHCMIQRCTNRYLRNTYADIHNQNCRLRILSGRQNHERLLQTVEEHSNILEALNKGDLTSASQAMRMHLQNSRESVYHYSY